MTFLMFWDSQKVCTLFMPVIDFLRMFCAQNLRFVHFCAKAQKVIKTLLGSAEKKSQKALFRAFLTQNHFIGFRYTCYTQVSIRSLPRTVHSVQLIQPYRR
jgi:hypothetical protein